VDDVRFKSFATTCHYPLCGEDPEIYAHVEVRELLEGEPIIFEPPRDRKKKSKRRKVLRAEWRTNFVNKLERLIEPNC